MQNKYSILSMLVLTLVAACTNNINIQCPFNSGKAPLIEWAKCYGGTGMDIAYSIQQTIDGGYIIAGGSDSNDDDVNGNHSSPDYWVLKLDNYGNIQWQKCLGGSGTDQASSIQQTTDGGYIVAGQSESKNGDVSGNHGGYDYWVVKLDNKGNIQWQKSLGGSGDEWAQSIQQTTDGGYIVAGRSRSNDGDVSGNHGSTNDVDADIWIVKLDNIGNIQWQKSLGGSGDDRASSVQQTTDGGYIVGGFSNSNDGDITKNYGYYDYWIVKLNSIGNIQWQKSFGGIGDDESSSIQQTTDGGYIIAGRSDSYNDVLSKHDFWVVKLDNNGSIQWQKSLGGIGDDEAYSIRQTKDGGYIVAGLSESNEGDVSGNHGSYDYWIVKLNSSGDILWQKCLGGSGADVASSIEQTADNGYIIAGFSQSNNGDVIGNHRSKYKGDFWIVKLK